MISLRGVMNLENELERRETWSRHAVIHKQNRVLSHFMLHFLIDHLNPIESNFNALLGSSLFSSWYFLWWATHRPRDIISLSPFVTRGTLCDHFENWSWQAFWIFCPMQYLANPSQTIQIQWTRATSNLNFIFFSNNKAFILNSTQSIDKKSRGHQVRIGGYCNDYVYLWSGWWLRFVHQIYCPR